MLPKTRCLAAATAALLLTCLAIPAGAGVIGSWDFDAQALTPTQGDGSQVLIGGVAATGAIWVSGQTSSSYTSWGYDTTNYPTQGTGNKTAGIRFAISTGGYTNITVSFDKQHSATASRYVRFQFSTNGGASWSDAAPGSLMQDTTTNWTNWSFNLSSFPAADDNPNFMFRMVTEFDPAVSSYTATVAGNTYSSLGTIAWDNVILTGTRSTLGNFIEDVPDVNQPCANPLGLTGFINTDYCAPTSAVNITEYWDVVTGSAFATYVDGNPNPGPTSALQFIGWWMNTNDDPMWIPANGNCPYRVNGNPMSLSGTILDDIVAGLVQYVRWDSAHDFGCTPPTLLVGKNGYNWTAALTRPGIAGWTSIKNEIDATPARPLIVSWEYWNPVNAFYDSTEGVTYYDWGPKTSGSSDSSHNETWNPTADVGHATTAVGYRQNYDPRNQGNPKDWVIVHDNWYNTAREVAIPWLYWDQPTQSWSTHCVALITADPATAPSVGTLSGAAGTLNPSNHTASQGSADAVAQITFTAAATENILVNAISLTASGTGNDSTEIAAVELVEDKDSSGTITKSDVSLVKTSSGFPANNGTMTIIIPGNWQYTIKAGTTSDLLVVYHISPTAAGGSTFNFTVNQVYATGLTSFLQCTVDDGATPPNPFSFTSSAVAVYIPAVTPDPGLGEWKLRPDGWLGGRFGITKPFPMIASVGDSFYVTEQDNTAGLKLKFVGVPPPEASPGDQIEFQGMIYTENDERVILIFQPPTPIPQAIPQRPFAMGIKSIGGGDWNWNPISHTGQRGVAGGVGLNNTGQLVRAAGEFYYVNEEMFMLGDGSAEPIRCVVTPGDVMLEPWWTHAVVTGVSSTEMVDGQLLPVLRVRTPDDIAAF